MMGQDEDWKVIRWIVPPPAFPVHVRPGTTNGSEHIPPKNPSPNILEATRGEVIVRLRELLDDTRFFQTHRNAFDRAQTRDFAASRLDLEAMIPVIEGKLPLLVTVDRESDIDAALRLAREFNVKLMIGGGAEAEACADA